MAHMIPTHRAPDLDLPILGSGRFVLAESKPETFTLLLFYRGYHCPICKGQLLDLQGKLAKLSDMGVEAIAISMDSEDRARKSAEEWKLNDLRLAHGLTEGKAREFGLYISSAISDREPSRFCEPGLFLIKPDSTLYFASVQSAPFTRPPLDELMLGIKYHREHGYPARGVEGAPVLVNR